MMMDRVLTYTGELAHRGRRTLVERFTRRLAELRARGVETRCFTLQLEDGARHVLGEGAPAFTVRVADARGHRALDSFDELSIAEAYMDGHLDIDGDMLAALKFRRMLGDRRPLYYLWETYGQPYLFGQQVKDRQWIASHYDLDAEFFTLWLDSAVRSYSHGFFESADDSLEVAMTRKFQHAFDAVGLAPGQRALDIGGGWGSFVEFAGSRGVHVTSLTLSAASERFMNELIARKRLPGRVVREHFLAYVPEERFDAILNFGVTEHLPDYPRTLAQYRRMLKPGRRIYLDSFTGARHGMPSFITKWVFEGNPSALSLDRYLKALAATPFELVDLHLDRADYFLTCVKWAENLERVREQVVQRWGEHLYRRFRLYLWGAASAFEARTLSAHHLVLELPRDAGGDR